MKFPAEIDLDFIASLVLNEWGGFISKLHLIDDIETFSGEIPELWLGLRGLDKDETVSRIWGGKKGWFPLYSQYLTDNLLGLMVGQGDAGLCLVYFIKNLRRIDTEEYMDGSLIGGVPASNTQIKNWEKNNGELPPDVRNLWERHHFMYLRNCGYLNSFLGISAGEMTPNLILGQRESELYNGRQVECCSIFNACSEFPDCLIKNIGERNWQSGLCEVDRYGSTCFDGTIYSPDELLSRDW